MLSEILQWSQNRSGWQRDALRRLVTGDTGEQGIEQLTQLCRQEFGLAAESKPGYVGQPLTKEHVPSASQPDTGVRLHSIGEVKGVNALAEDQHIEFAPEGLTVIYGDNGSGKSGYVRILKRLCRARSLGEILPNAFAETSQGQPEAKLTYTLTNSHAPIEYEWTDGDSAPEVLGNVSVFDSDCATVHIEKDNDLAFTPYGLDVLPRLARLCQKVKDGLNQERDLAAAQASPSVSAMPEAYAETPVGKLIQALGPDSKIDAFTKLAAWTDAEDAELEAIRKQEKSNPTEQKGVLVRLQKRLERLRDTLGKWEDSFSGESLERIRNKVRSLKSAKTAAEAAANALFSEQPIKGLGDDAWKVLWEAARKFSKEAAYPGDDFPHIGEGARCVLCLQPLEPDAKARLQDFEDFVRQETQTAVTKERQALSEMVSGIRSLPTWWDTELIAELKTKDAQGAETLERMREIQGSVQEQLADCVEKETLEADVWKQFEMDRSCTQALEVALTRLQEEISQLEKLEDPEQFARLGARRMELESRQWLHGLLPEVTKEIERYQRLRRLDAAIKSTSTSKITRKSSELTTMAVTEPLRSAFADELRALGLRHLTVEVASAGGHYGEQRYQIGFTNSNARVGRIVSEGEYRCIALAAFLSEHVTAATKSSFVIDDPVSSLDHQFRRYVAERLVKEAKHRQVIVFTHDLVFLLKLRRDAKAERVNFSTTQLWREGELAGIQHEGMHWDAMTVKNRIKYLNRALDNARPLYGQDPLAYRPLAESIYGKLRDSWERAVEEVLFDGAILRYGFEIHTQQIRHLSDIEEPDLVAVEKGMNKCSIFMAGHSRAPEENDPIPPPDEIGEDIQRLKQYVAAIHKRREN